GIDAMAVAGDDGLVLRLPYSEEPPGADLLLGQFFRETRPGVGEGAVRQGAGGDGAGDRKDFAGRGDGQPGELSEVVLADVMDNVGSSAGVRLGPCCCRGATRASGSRCGSSGNGPPSCWTWPGSTPSSRSWWRACANASMTSTSWMRSPNC